MNQVIRVKAKKDCGLREGFSYLYRRKATFHVLVGNLFRG
jgi:hypothetical protein